MGHGSKKMPGACPARARRTNVPPMATWQLCLNGVGQTPQQPNILSITPFLTNPYYMDAISKIKLTFHPTPKETRQPVEKVQN